jgi:PAS domain S-box-containing protein
MTAQTKAPGDDLEQRIVARTEELLRTNALLGEEIARHEQTERALRESSERMAAMIGAAPEAVIVIDATGRVDEWNPQAERTFGWSRDEAVGQMLSHLIMPTRFRAAHEAGIARYMATKVPRVMNRPMELAALNRQGIEFPIELSVWPIPDGQALRFGAFIRDISLRKAIEKGAQARSERALHFRDALYELAKLDKTDFDEALAIILKTAARELRVERISYWSLSGDPLTSSRAKVYVKTGDRFEGASPEHQIDAVRHPNYFDALAKHRPVVADRAHVNPATTEFAETHLRPLGIVSTLDIGVWLRGRMTGVLRHGHIGEPREWQSDEIEFATSIASSISLALEASQRHAVSVALQASEEKYRLVVENASEAIVVAQDGFIRFANPVAVSMSGYSRDEYYAMPFINLIHPDDRERVITNYRKRMAGEEGEKNYVFRIVSKQGDVIWLQINAVPLQWNGRPATLNFLADITERERLQQDLRQTLAEREAILQSSLIGIVFTRHRIIHWINRTLEVELLGYAEGELVGKSTETFYVSRQEFDDYGRDAYREIAEGKTWSCEMQLRRKDGTLFWAQETGKAMDPADLAQGAIWVMTDISRRRQAEEELRRALAQERELSELKSRFVSMTSHEFRTPLATILSATELLERYGERLPADEKSEMIGLIKSAVGRMTSMLEDVLLIGKADAGRVEFHPKPIDIGKLAAAVVEEVGRSTEHRCPIATHIAGDCTTRLLDEKLVRHILGNLLSNAAKYSPAGAPVRLEIECSDGSTRFEVRDKGIGIPADDQPRLFSTFHRGGNVSNVSGTGLGLAIVKKCVDVHGGQIAFTSATGRGTTFAVMLPQRAPSSGAIDVRDGSALADDFSP